MGVLWPGGTHRCLAPGMQSWKFTPCFLGGFGLLSVIPPFPTYHFFFMFFIYLPLLRASFVLDTEGDTKVNNLGSPFKQLLPSFPPGALAGVTGWLLCPGLGGGSVRRTREFQF